MLKKTFYTISVIFHPLLMPSLGALIITNFTHMALLPQPAKTAILLIFLVSTLIFPLAVLPLLFYQGLIKSLTMTDKKERLLPLFITVVFYYLCYYVSIRFGVPEIYQQFALAAFVSLLLASLISIGYKISNHMVGLGGLMGLISILQYYQQLNLGYLLMATILMAGLAGTARLYLEHHTESQVYSGFLLGYIATFGTMMFMQ
jgi:uncharacterized membrane protein YjjP (DUF1212 family)